MRIFSASLRNCYVNNKKKTKFYFWASNDPLAGSGRRYTYFYIIARQPADAASDTTEIRAKGADHEFGGVG